MEDGYLYDITDVCKSLNTTSRTLRFYEEKGIISSTKYVNSHRRKYTIQQVDNIRNVLILRNLGLSIKSIQQLQNKNDNLKNEIISRRAEIYASIDKHIREIDKLNEALTLIDSGNDIFRANWENHLSVSDIEINIVNICSRAIVNGNTDVLFNHLSDKLKEYMPQDVFRTIRKDTLKPLGAFVSFQKTEPDIAHHNKIYQYIKYSKLGLKATFIFHNRMIDGLWLSYYEL